MDVHFFIRRIQIVARTEGSQHVCDQLPFCLRGHALTWHTELDDATLSSLSHDLNAWYAALLTEFRPDPISARAEARKLRFDFNRSELKLSDYLYLKVSRLRAAGTLDAATIKSELWEGLDSKLALIVRPYEFESVDDFRRRIREAEPFCSPRLADHSTSYSS